MTTPTVPTLTFEDAEYVAPAGGPGRSKGPNQFTSVVAEIAMKVDDKTKKPIAKGFTFQHAAVIDKDGKEVAAAVEARDKEIKRFKRLLSDAGESNTPQVTVRAVSAPVKNPVNGKASATSTRVTFWTTKRQIRTAKPADTK